MLIYIQCINEFEKEWSVAFNPKHIVLVDDANSHNSYYTTIIKTSEGSVYRTKEDFLSVVGRVNGSL